MEFRSKEIERSYLYEETETDPSDYCWDEEVSVGLLKLSLLKQLDVESELDVEVLEA